MLKKKIWGIFNSLNQENFNQTQIVSLTNSHDEKEEVKKVIQELIDEKEIMVCKKNKHRYERYKEDESEEV